MLFRVFIPQVDFPCRRVHLIFSACNCLEVLEAQAVFFRKSGKVFSRGCRIQAVASNPLAFFIIADFRHKGYIAEKLIGVISNFDVCLCIGHCFKFFDFSFVGVVYAF